jgi:glycosyltransferase 2 family protein
VAWLVWRRHGRCSVGLHVLLADARGSRPFFGTTAGGDSVFVKVLGREERSSDLLFRFYRWLRFRGLGDEVIASSLKQSIEQEALVSALAADDGIRTPRLLGVTEVDADRLALAFVRIQGSSLDGVPAERLTDEVLRGIWRLVAGLHRAGIAHRDLRLANLFLDDGGQAWLIDFGFGTVRSPSPSPAPSTSLGAPWPPLRRRRVGSAPWRPP